MSFRGLLQDFVLPSLFNLVGCLTLWNIFIISYNCVLISCARELSIVFHWLFSFCFNCRWVQNLNLFCAVKSERVGFVT